jgi:hypothetical protein
MTRTRHFLSGFCWDIARQLPKILKPGTDASGCDLPQLRHVVTPGTEAEGHGCHVVMPGTEGMIMVIQAVENSR